MAKEYTTVANIENYLLINVDEAFEPVVESWIQAISRQMDYMANRTLMASADDETYKFDGNGKGELLDLDIQSITTLTLDGTEIADTDYYLYPANTSPKTRLVLDNYGRFARGKQNVVIVGKFGLFADGELPADLTLAATILTAGVVNKTNNQNKKIKSQTIGRYSVTYEDDKGWNDLEMAKSIIQSYRRVTF